MVVRAVAVVLVVEDDPGIRLVVTESLRDACFDVRAAASAADALSVVMSGDRIDVMVLDLMLNGVSGADLLKTVRSLPGFQDVPAVVTTGAEPSRDVFPPAGSYQAFLRKPYRLSALIATLTNLVDELRLRDATG